MSVRLCDRVISRVHLFIVNTVLFTPMTANKSYSLQRSVGNCLQVRYFERYNIINDKHKIICHNILLFRLCMILCIYKVGYKCMCYVLFFQSLIKIWKFEKYKLVITDAL